MPIPLVTCGSDIIISYGGAQLVQLSATATGSPSSWAWTILSYPIGSTASTETRGDFVNGEATVQNPQFLTDANIEGTYVIQAIATNASGDSDPDEDKQNCQQPVIVKDQNNDIKYPNDYQWNWGQYNNSNISKLNDLAVTASGNINSHTNNTNDPHNVTSVQVGLGNVTNDAQLKRADNDWNGYSEETTVASGDWILIEKSGGGLKKKIKVENLPSEPVSSGEKVKVSEQDAVSEFLSDKISTTSGLQYITSDKGGGQLQITLSPVYGSGYQSICRGNDSRLSVATTSGIGVCPTLTGLTTDFLNGAGSFSEPAVTTVGQAGYCPALNNDLNTFLNGEGDWGVPGTPDISLQDAYNDGNIIVVAGSGAVQIISSQTKALDLDGYIRMWDLGGDPQGGEPNTGGGETGGILYIKDTGGEMTTNLFFMDSSNNRIQLTDEGNISQVGPQWTLTLNGTTSFPQHEAQKGKLSAKWVDPIYELIYTDSNGNDLQISDAGAINLGDGVSSLPLNEQASGPTHVANKGFLYTKEESSITELFYKNDQGTSIQLTKDSGVNTNPIDLVGLYKQSQAPSNDSNTGFLYSKEADSAVNLFYLDSDDNEVQLTSSGVIAWSVPVNTKGDIYTYSNEGTRLAVGASGQLLSAEPSEDEGLKWIDKPTDAETLQGRNISANTPASGQILVWNTEQWVPAGQPGGPHATTHGNGESDEISVEGLSGTLADRQDADKLQGRDISSNAPASGQVYAWNTAEWVPVDQTGGHLIWEWNDTDLSQFDSLVVGSGVVADFATVWDDGGVNWVVLNAVVDIHNPNIDPDNSVVLPISQEFTRPYAITAQMKIDPPVTHNYAEAGIEYGPFLTVEFGGLRDAYYLLIHQIDNNSPYTRKTRVQGYPSATGYTFASFSTDNYQTYSPNEGYGASMAFGVEGGGSPGPWLHFGTGTYTHGRSGGWITPPEDVTGAKAGLGVYCGTDYNGAWCYFRDIKVWDLSKGWPAY